MTVPAQLRHVVRETSVGRRLEFYLFDGSNDGAICMWLDVQPVEMGVSAEQFLKLSQFSAFVGRVPKTELPSRTLDSQGKVRVTDWFELKVESRRNWGRVAAIQLEDGLMMRVSCSACDSTPDVLAIKQRVIDEMIASVRRTEASR